MFQKDVIKGEIEFTDGAFLCIYQGGEKKPMHFMLCNYKCSLLWAINTISIIANYYYKKQPECKTGGTSST